ncbi:hypothetical protein V2J94_17315 [Streptomyces sp. DSM 41524]|uniref:Uncharacterized protein n=1 Tax=Streptomyces asiaticus subsp. ignotus TaxID=3098222 RepID=A0ABU7PWZ7_9ACTN|nr:hypothetical protein [Streptomyces sp. DSM 41524]
MDVLQYPVCLPLTGRLALVPLGRPVHQLCLREVQGGIDLVLDLRGRDRRDEVHPGRQQCGDVRVGHQFGIGDHPELPLAGHRPQVLHRPDDLADLGDAATEDTGVDGDTAIGGHREPSLDLLQIHPPR